MKAKWLAFGVVITALGSTACTSSTSNPGNSASDVHGPGTAAMGPLVSGGTFVEAVNTDLGSLDPYLTIVGATSSFDQFLYDSLLNADPSGRPVGQLAATWTATTTTATFTLKPGITCSDGAALKASDVAADIAFVADPAHKSALLGQYVQPGTTATGDDATGKITIRSGSSDPFLLSDLGALPIVCRAGLADGKGLAAGKYGTGLYVMADALAGDHYTAKRRKDYRWGPTGFRTDEKGLPDRVEFKVVANETTAANLLAGGQLNYASIAGADGRRLAAQHLFSVNQYQPLGELYFNQAAGHPGADAAVRKAIVQGLDLPQVGKVLSNGNGRPMTQLLDYLSPTPCRGDTVSGNLPSTDIAAANAALQSAGWVKGNDGVRSRDGKQLRFVLPYQTSPGEQTAAVEFIQSLLKKVGVVVQPKVVDATSLGTVLKNDSWDLTLEGIGWAQPSGMVPWFSGPSFPHGGENIGAVHDPEYERLTAKAAKMAGAAGCPTWRQAESTLIKNIDVVPFFELAVPSFGKKATFAAPQSARFPFSIRMTTR